LDRDLLMAGQEPRWSRRLAGSDGFARLPETTGSYFSALTRQTGLQHLVKNTILAFFTVAKFAAKLHTVRKSLDF